MTVMSFTYKLNGENKTMATLRPGFYNSRKQMEDIAKQILDEYYNSKETNIKLEESSSWINRKDAEEDI